MGLVDEPRQQAQGPFLVDAGRNCIVYGGAGSGKSTLLRTLATSLALSHSPRRGFIDPSNRSTTATAIAQMAAWLQRNRRIPGHGEKIAELKQRKILIDGKAGALLLQIFTENQLGPIFFEFIQRKGDEGFGEGNFKALFESIEADQIARGVLKPDAA